MECQREIDEKDDGKSGTFRPKAGLENLGRVAQNYRDENQKNKGGLALSARPPCFTINRTSTHPLEKGGASSTPFNNRFLNFDICRTRFRKLCIVYGRSPVCIAF